MAVNIDITIYDHISFVLTPLDNYCTDHFSHDHYLDSIIIRAGSKFFVQRFSVRETFISNEKIILTPSGIRAKGPIIYLHFYIAFTKVKNKKQKTKQNHM